jgi:hypothetical protein
MWWWEKARQAQPLLSDCAPSIPIVRSPLCRTSPRDLTTALLSPIIFSVSSRPSSFGLDQKITTRAIVSSVWWIKRTKSMSGFVD